MSERSDQEKAIHEAQKRADKRTEEWLQEEKETMDSFFDDWFDEFGRWASEGGAVERSYKPAEKPPLVDPEIQPVIEAQEQTLKTLDSTPLENEEKESATLSFLFTTFEENLEMAREFIQNRMAVADPIQLGWSLTQSLIVKTLVELASYDSDYVRIEVPYLGTFIRDIETATFEPEVRLKEDKTTRKLRLKEFLDLQMPGIRHLIWWDFENQEAKLEEFPKMGMEEQTEPMVGGELYENLGAAMIEWVTRRDPELKDVPFLTIAKALCLALHDAIISGVGVELTSIGIIYPDFRFEADPILLETITAVRNSPRARKARGENTETEYPKFVVGNLSHDTPPGYTQDDATFSFLPPDDDLADKEDLEIEEAFRQLSQEALAKEESEEENEK